MAKQKSDTIFSPLASLYRLDYFKEGQVKTNQLLACAGAVLLLLSMLNVVKASTGYTQFTEIGAFFYTLIGVPLVLGVLYVLLHVFIAAFTEKEKVQPFWKSMSVFLAVTMPFLFLGHSLNFLREALSFMRLFSIIGWVVIIALFIYLLVNMTLHLKHFHKTTNYKVIASLILVHLFLFFMGMFQYLAYLVANLR